METKISESLESKERVSIEFDGLEYALEYNTFVRNNDMDTQIVNCLEFYQDDECVFSVLPSDRLFIEILVRHMNAWLEEVDTYELAQKDLKERTS